MNLRAGLLALMACAGPALGQEAAFPALHDVTGVAADDQLNIRAEPSAEAAVIGGLAPDQKVVEVIAVVDGWAQVNTGEGSGWAKAEFLTPSPVPAWTLLTTPLRCSGTEPFWSFGAEPALQVAVMQTPSVTNMMLTVAQTFPATHPGEAAGMALQGGFVMMRPVLCSDGMSDRAYGIAVDIFLAGAEGGHLSGCCSIAP